MAEITIEGQKKKWFIFPDMLSGVKIRSYHQNEETQARGAFLVGQNVKFTDGLTPTLRDGYEPIGTEAADSTPVNRGWVFERRDGVQVEFKTYSTKVDFWIHGVSTAWLLFKGSFTSGQEFGFGNIGQSDQTVGWGLMCNGTENPFRFTAVHALLSSTTVNTITKTGSTTWTAEGFATAGTRSVIINGTEYAYTGGEGTTTLTGVTPNPTAEAVNSIVMQSPLELTGVVGGGTDPEKFSVAMAHDGRLHYAKTAKKSVWAYSRLNNPDDVATGSSDGDGGAIEVETGGPIIAFGKLNKTAVCLKERMIKILDYIQFGSRLDSPRYQTLVSTDDKSTTLGATNQKSTFATPLGLVFTTPDKKMMLLTGITGNSEPQYVFLSDPIQSIFQQGVHDNAAGICFDNKIFYSFKSDATATYNDTVIVGDLKNQSLDNNQKVIPIFWYTPYVGWNVNDWTIIYNSTDKKHELHWHSSYNSNVYRMIDEKSDNTTSFTATLRSHSETFDAPHHQKKADAVMIEIKMLENTVLTATVLLDQDGYTLRKEYVLRGTRTNSLLQGATYNPFGASSFGSQRIGSNDQQSELKRYFFELELPANTPFFSMSLQLSGDTEITDWEVIRWGARITEYLFETNRKFKLNSAS